MSTPGSEELHHPHLATLQHHLVEVVVGKFDYILLAATGALLLQAERRLLKCFHLRNLRYRLKCKKKNAHLFVAGATRASAQPLLHKATQGTQSSIHNGLATASTWNTW